MPLSVPADVVLPTVTPTVLPHVIEPTPVTTVAPVQQRHSVAVGRPVVREREIVVQTLFQSPIPRPLVVERPRSEVITVTVQAGDTILSVSTRFGIQRETLVWSNEELEANPDLMYVGQVLYILPIDGVYYTVKEGESLDEIALRFKVETAAITSYEYNNLRANDVRVEVGHKLIVPGGIKPFQPQVIDPITEPVPVGAPRGDGTFVWPVGGYISQGYWNLHRAIDIAGKQGDPVVAVDAGTVVYAEWERSGYGNLVIVDHGNGFTSYYGHLYGFYVDVGDPVKRGQPIGTRGNTGRSTGPHLHFEVRQDGAQQSPIDLLPKQ